MPSLPVFVSHTGKTLQLSCSPTTRVDAVQQALVALTGLSLADQIVMCEGSRLDPHKSLSAYGLPVDEYDQPHDVFLYNRALLKPGAPPPAGETAPRIAPEVPAQRGAQETPHSLDKASSPLLRALPEYQRHFQFHAQQGSAAAEASQQRYAVCAQLVGEQEVQALSIDAARTNIEAHFSYICTAFEGFMQRYQQQHAVHAEVLAVFEDDLQFLSSTEVHPSLKRRGCMRLLDLVDAQRLREGWEACHKSHRHFAAKVAELESLFALLKGDVESLFMQAPSVDLEELNAKLAEMHGHLDEQASIVQALSSDYTKVQQILDQTTSQLEGASTASISVQLSDTCQMLETMHESHVSHLLPRVTSCDAALEEFTEQCVKCKNALTQDVQHQLQCIASQQSRIREMKDKLALFGEALGKQEAGVGELMLPRRVAAAYKQCLAESVRRTAFAEKYAQSAAKLAESMGRFREKEVATREAFRRHVEKYLPLPLLERMGLQAQPPHCQVTLPSSSYQQLIPVTVEDMRRLQLPTGGGSSILDAAALPKHPGPASDKAQQEGEEAAAEGEAGGPVFEDLTTSLQIENATLRAELASRVAVDCIRAAQLPPPRQQPEAGAAASGTSSAGATSEVGGSAADVASSTSTEGQQQHQVPPAAAQKFERALAAKDGLIAELQTRLAKAQSQTATYEQRILSLEEQLSSLAATSARAVPKPPLRSSQEDVQGAAPRPTGDGAAAGRESPNLEGSAAAGGGSAGTARLPAHHASGAGSPGSAGGGDPDSGREPLQMKGGGTAGVYPSASSHPQAEGSCPGAPMSAPSCAAPAVLSGSPSHGPQAPPPGSLSASQGGSGMSSVLGTLGASTAAGEALGYSSSSAGAAAGAGGGGGEGGSRVQALGTSYFSEGSRAGEEGGCELSRMPGTSGSQGGAGGESGGCGEGEGAAAEGTGSGAPPLGVATAAQEQQQPHQPEEGKLATGGGEHADPLPGRTDTAGDSAPPDVPSRRSAAGATRGAQPPPGTNTTAQPVELAAGRAGPEAVGVGPRGHGDEPAEHEMGADAALPAGGGGGAGAASAADEGSDVEGIEVLSSDSDGEGGYGNPGSRADSDRVHGGNG